MGFANSLAFAKPIFISILLRKSQFAIDEKYTISLIDLSEDIELSFNEIYFIFAKTKIIYK